MIVFLVTSCTGINFRRVFYRFNYSSTDNTISTVEVYVLTAASTSTTRVTIEWNDVAVNLATNTTIPRRNSRSSQVIN